MGSSSCISFSSGMAAAMHLGASCSKSSQFSFVDDIHLHMRNKLAKTRYHPMSRPIYSPEGSCRRLNALPNVDDFFWGRPETPILDMVDSPMQLKNMSLEELEKLADEIRSEILVLSRTRTSPLNVSLAVVELTIAIHRVFHAPIDKILWDAGEQTFVHKILTGRRSIMHTLGRKGGISGFTSRFESDYDAFAAGHGCNSVSAGLGMAVARDIKGKNDRIVTVISNWTTMAGQVYEAMSNAGYLDSNLVVILNDTRHCLHPKQEDGVKMTVNSLSSTLSKLQSSKSFRKFREAAKVVTKKIGKGMHELAAKVDEYARGMIGPLGSTLFEELGLYYIGPVDGHNIGDLTCVLHEVASMNSTGPVLVHIVTEERALTDPNVEPIFKPQGTTKSGSSISPPKFLCDRLSSIYNERLAVALVAEAERDKGIVVVHAGMGTDPSFQLFQSRFPERFFDMGMSEQHSVTFAAGLSCGGLKPFCIIPSTYLQRAYDQIIHDIDQQRIPVRFVITSAGLVGPDGPTQCGAFDITFMACLPNMVVMAPANDDDVYAMVATAASIDDRPVCFRFPRGAGISSISSTNSMCCTGPFEIGKGEILVEGKDVALLGYGVMVQNCLKAYLLLSRLGIHVTVANARFCKPLDMDLIRKLCREHKYVITVEEGAIGGFGSHVSQFMALDGLLDGSVQWRPIVLPDAYLDHASPREQRDMAGLSAHHIAATALSLLGRNRDALVLIDSKGL